MKFFLIFFLLVEILLAKEDNQTILELLSKNTEIPFEKPNYNFIEDINIYSNKTNNLLLYPKDKIKGMIFDNVAVDIGIALWGYKYWGWGEKDFHFQTEPWFDYNSKTGGSDKTGHFYMTYLLSRVLSSRMEDRGYSLESSSLIGSLSGMLSMTLLEVGDGTSEYGFSKEDLIADGLGSILAYLIRSNPRVDDFIDIRLEYLPTDNYVKNGDNTTDYSGMRHLIAFKLSGFNELNNSWLQFIELQTGYYSRGYRSIDTEPQSQHLYFGIGISLASLSKYYNVTPLNNLFEFYQPGHTYTDVDLWSRK